MESAAGQGGQALLHEGCPAVDQPGDLRAVRARPSGHRVNVRLVVLPDVRGISAGHRALLAHPRDRDRRVEPSGEGDPDTFTDR